MSAPVPPARVGATGPGVGGTVVGALMYGIVPAGTRGPPEGGGPAASAPRGAGFRARRAEQAWAAPPRGAEGTPGTFPHRRAAPRPPGASPGQLPSSSRTQEDPRGERPRLMTQSPLHANRLGRGVLCEGRLPSQPDSAPHGVPAAEPCSVGCSAGGGRRPRSWLHFEAGASPRPRRGHGCPHCLPPSPFRLGTT